MMKIGVPKETAAGERRVALVPDVAKSLQAKVSEKIEPLVESGAGAGAGHNDASYEEAGASVGDASAAWGAEVVLHVRPPSTEEIAKRLGAIVTGFDIRRAAWEQIASLGGRPLELDFIPDAEGEGGYARPLTDEENQQVRDALEANAAKQDIILTTAAIPGRPAPLLVTAEAVRGMAPGSVIVDLAAETGGNCELTKPGQTVVEGGVKVIGPRNLPSEMPAPASQLYAKNLENLLGLIVSDE